jgi:hypothetical protein
LEDGDLDFSAVEGLLQQMTSVAGVLRLVRDHSAHARGYALLAQNIMDDATAAAEAAFAMASAQDVVAAAICYAACLGSLAFCCRFGLGWGAFVLVCYLLRPPFLRAVPGVVGFRAYFSNLPSRSADDLL